MSEKNNKMNEPKDKKAFVKKLQELYEEGTLFECLPEHLQKMVRKGMDSIDREIGERDEQDFARDVRKGREVVASQTLALTEPKFFWLGTFSRFDYMTVLTFRNGDVSVAYLDEEGFAYSNDDDIAHVNLGNGELFTQRQWDADETVRSMVIENYIQSEEDEFNPNMSGLMHFASKVGLIITQEQLAQHEGEEG